MASGAIAGENNGLQITLDTESYDYVEYTRGGVGFSLSVVHPLDEPIMEQSGINIQPGTATKLGVSSTLIRTTEEAIKRFKPYERNCWVESEIGFHYIPYDMFFQYSMSNCLFEAAMQEAHKTCDCIPSFIKESTNPCFGKELKCYYNIIKKLGNLQVSHKCFPNECHHNGCNPSKMVQNLKLSVNFVGNGNEFIRYCWEVVYKTKNILFSLRFLHLNRRQW